MQYKHWKKNELPEPLQELMRQRHELRHKRKELVNQLYELIAELEGRPVQRRNIGFPFNLIVRFVYKALGTIEAMIERTIRAFVR